MPAELQDTERVAAVCRETLGERKFAAAYEEGGQLELSEAAAAL